MRYLKQHIQTFTALIVIVGMATIGSKVLNVSNALTGSNVTTPTTPVTQGSISLPGVTATSVDSFIDSEGVNIHTSYLSTPYNSASAIYGALNTLGIHNVRDNPAPSPGATEMPNLKSLAGQTVLRKAIKFNFIINTTQALAYVNAPTTNPDTVKTFLDQVNANGLAGSTISIEGANELDFVNGSNYSPNWANSALSIQQTIVTDNAGQFPLVGPSMVGIYDTADASTLAATGVGNYINVGNIHSYPRGGTTPENTIASHVSNEAKVAGSKPIWSTETGYNDYPAGTQPIPVNQADQGVLDPRIFLTYYQHNVAKTFIYELLNQANGGTNFQDYWGLFNNNLTPKPSGQAIGNMNHILDQNNTGAPTNPVLNYQIGGGDANLQQMLLAKHTATGDHYDLVVWENDLPSGATKPITLSFQSNMDVVRYTPSSTASPIASYNSVTSVPGATSGPAITIYDITAAPAPPPPPCTTNCGGSSGGGSGGGTGSGTQTTGTGQGTTTKTITLTSLGSANSPIKTASVTLAPDTTTPTKDITKVSYYIDGKLTATVDKPPFTYKLTSATLKSGCHTIKTVVYTTAGSANSSSRQLCVAFAKNTTREREWGIGILCLIVILLVLAEFVPFYPTSSHVVSRTALRLWAKIRHKNTPPNQDNTLGPPQNQVPNSSADSSSYTPGHIFQPLDKH